MPFNVVYNKKRQLKLSVSVSFSGAGASTDSRVYIRSISRVRGAFWFRLAFLLGFTPNLPSLSPSLPPFYFPPYCSVRRVPGSVGVGVHGWGGGGGFPTVRVL